MDYLKKETFMFQWEGNTHTFNLYELEDGFWAVECEHPLFKEIFGTSFIPKADGFSHTAEQIGITQPDFMNAMWSPFQDSCDRAIKSIQALK